MNSNLDSDRAVTTNKMYPMDLAPQKITIVKNVSNAEVKMAHLITGQPKTTSTAQIITHTGSVGMMRPTTQIISSGVSSSQPQMIVSGSPILQGTQIVSQASQLINQTPQIISQSQIIGPSGQIIGPGTQIISQGTQLSVSNANNIGTSNVPSCGSPLNAGTQVLNMGNLVSGTGNLVVSTSVRTLPPSVRVLPPLPHTNIRPAVQQVQATVNVTNSSGVVVGKSVSSHVPRGLAAGASLAVRPVTPPTQAISNQGSTWSSRSSGRSAVVYGPRGSPRLTAPAPSVAAAASTPTQTSHTIPSHSAIITLPSPTSTVLTSSTGVGAGRAAAGVVQSSTPTLLPSSVPAPGAPAPRPLPLLRNYQTKVVGVTAVGVRAPVGNSAPSQLYYEVPRATTPTHGMATPLSAATTLGSSTHGPLASLGLVTSLGTTHGLATPPTHVQYARERPIYSHQPIDQRLHQVSVASAVQALSSMQESRTLPLPLTLPLPQHATPLTPLTSLSSAHPAPRPTILRKRDMDGSPTKTAGVGPPYLSEGQVSVTGWEDVPAGGGGGAGSGSTTVSAASTPPHDDDYQVNLLPAATDISPRKKPRKQILNNEVRQCEFPTDEPPLTPPPVVINPPPKRPALRAGYVMAWRARALHFVRAGDVRVRAPRRADLCTLQALPHVRAAADGWKVHHLTAQMDDLVSLERDVWVGLRDVLRALDAAPHAALRPHAHAIQELLKGNIQRSKIVCEGIQEAREDILRVFTHRSIVSEILSRQADKRCFRKHRIQS